MEIGNIISGHINELLGLNKNISEERMKICRCCPLFSNLFGGLCNHKLYLDPQTNTVSLTKKDGYVKGCGCRLKAKTTNVNATCVAGKW